MRKSIEVWVAIDADGGYETGTDEASAVEDNGVATLVQTEVK